MADSICQVMEWWLAASSHYVNSQVNTLKPRQNGRHFADDMFKCIFLNENVWIPIEISLTFVPKSWINNNPALFQIMAWRRPGDKPLSEPMMVSSLTHICIYAFAFISTPSVFGNHVCDTKLFPGINELMNTPYSALDQAANSLPSVQISYVCNYIYSPLPTKTYTTLVPIFEKKGYFFNGRREFAKSRKRGHFAGMSPRNFEKG